MYNYYSQPAITTTTTASIPGSIIWTAIAAVLAILGGILVYVLFLKPDKDYNNKFVGWLKEFLNFKKMLIEVILKITYLILAIFITLFSFNLIKFNFIGFLVLLVGGNVLLRIIYEGSLIMIMIWKNTTEINKKLNKK